MVALQKGHHPTRVIFYHDGLSEGEFVVVPVEEEVQELKGKSKSSPIVC